MSPTKNSTNKTKYAANSFCCIFFTRKFRFFAKNTDLETGIVFDSEKARTSFEAFKEKHNVTIAEGNIFVASPN